MNDSKCSKKNCEICNLDAFLSRNWHKYLKDEFKKPYFQKIYSALHTEETFYPQTKKIFAFSRYFKIKETRVVIIAYEPSYVKDESNGLAFSAYEHIDIPLTTGNILKEVYRSHVDKLENFSLKTIDQRDKSTYNRFFTFKIQTIQRNLYQAYGITLTGDLTEWAKQGVLLLNMHMTVLKNKRSSHTNLGWNKFTDKILELVNDKCENVVFMLWGTYAHRKEKLINKDKHLILKSVPPATCSFTKGFYENNHFILANEYLIKHDKGQIDWTNTRSYDV